MNEEVHDLSSENLRLLQANFRNEPPSLHQHHFASKLELFRHRPSSCIQCNNNQ